MSCAEAVHPLPSSDLARRAERRGQPAYQEFEPNWPSWARHHHRCHFCCAVGTGSGLGAKAEVVSKAVHWPSNGQAWRTKGQLGRVVASPFSGPRRLAKSRPCQSQLGSGHFQGWARLGCMADLRLAGLAKCALTPAVHCITFPSTCHPAERSLPRAITMVGSHNWHCLSRPGKS